MLYTHATYVQTVWDMNRINVGLAQKLYHYYHDQCTIELQAIVQYENTDQ